MLEKTESKNEQELMKKIFSNAPKKYEINRIFITRNLALTLGELRCLRHNQKISDVIINDYFSILSRDERCKRFLFFNPHFVQLLTNFEGKFDSEFDNFERVQGYFQNCNINEIEKVLKIVE